MEPAGWPLVGRDEELALLADVVGDARGSLVVAGGMGVGKSRLVNDLLAAGAGAGADGARPHGVQVRATRSTATIPFGPFAAWADTPGAQDGTAGDRLGALQAISRNLLAGADHLVLAVDDAHLLDAGSAALVLHLVTQTRASVVVTVRSGEPCPDAVTALWKEGLAPRVELQALSRAETVELVEQVLDGPLDLPTQRRFWSLTEGTPLYVREVLRAGLDAGVLARDGGVWRWRGELAVAGRLADLVGDRLASAEGDEREVLELLAFGEPLPVGIVDELGLRDALAGAERRGFVVVDPGPARGAAADDPTVRLVHPLYAEVLRRTVPTLAARRHQGRLATAAAAVGWHERDPLRVASWWVESGAPPEAPAVFLRAARRASALAEWELTERMAGAAERSGAGPWATLLRSMALDLLGRWDEADASLAELARGDLDDDVAAEVAIARAGLLFFNRGRLDAALDVLAAAGEGLPVAARARVRSQAAYLAVTACELGLAVEHAMAAMADAGPDVETRLGALSVATLAWALRGDTREAITAAELALPHVQAVVGTNPNPVALNAIGVLPVAYAMALVIDGRLADASVVAELTMHAARASDFRILYAITSALDGRMALWRGRADVARDRGEEGLVIVRDLRAPFPWPAGVAAMGAGQLGDAATARAALAWLDESPHASAKVFDIEVRQGAAWLAAAQGELSSARAQLAEVADIAGAAEARVFEILALLDIARLGGAAEAAPRLAALAERVEGVWLEAVVDYAAALARDDGPALDVLAGRFESLGFLLLAAEAAATAAAAHRAEGRHGSRLASAANASRLAARCGDPRTPALRDLDAEPVLATLTDREREVVEQAARGLSNREIAAQLYVSVRTVHTHLHRAYAKLGVNDRAQLAGVLRRAERD